MAVLGAEVPAADPVLVLGGIAGHPDLVEAGAGGQEQAGPERAADEDIRLAGAVEGAEIVVVLGAEVPPSDPVLVLGGIAGHPDLVEAGAGGQEQAGPERAADEDI